MSRGGESGVRSQGRFWAHKGNGFGWGLCLGWTGGWVGWECEQTCGLGLGWMQCMGGCVGFGVQWIRSAPRVPRARIEPGSLAPQRNALPTELPPLCSAGAEERGRRRAGHVPGRLHAPQGQGHRVLRQGRQQRPLPAEKPPPPHPAGSPALPPHPATQRATRVLPCIGLSWFSVDDVAAPAPPTCSVHDVRCYVVIFCAQRRRILSGFGRLGFGPRHQTDNTEGATQPRTRRASKCAAPVLSVCIECSNAPCSYL